MTTFFGKIFTSLLIGISSLFGGHQAPVITQTSVTATTTVSVATTTPVSIVQSVVRSVSHTTPVKTTVTPVVVPPVIAATATVVAPSLKCVTGKIEINGSCQWSASSTAEIEAIQKQAQQAEQDQELGVQDDLLNQIANLQQEQQEYQSDIDALQAKVARACTLTTFTVPTGLAAVSAGENGGNCSDISEEATPEIQADEQQKSNLQTQINEDNSELDS